MRLSHSKMWKYDFCPRAFFHYYMEGWAPKTKSPSLLYGDAVDQGLSALFRTGEDPVAVFETQWLKHKDTPVQWGKRNTWEGFFEMGKKVLSRFMDEETPRIRDVDPAHVQFPLSAELDGLIFTGFADLYAKVDGLLTLVDFKTAQSSYDPDEVRLNEQLTAYWWLIHESGLPVDRVAFCVLLKQKDPKIEWHFATRTQKEVSEYREKLRMLVADIDRGRFPKKTSSCGHMGGCDYKPLCLGDETRIRETLVLKDEIPEDEVVI